MAIVTANFYRIPGIGISSGQYPLFDTPTIPSSYLISTQTIKATDDIQQIVRCPWFNGCDQVNLCTINGRIYWITAFDQTTIEQSQVRYMLDINMPSQVFNYGSNITGYWAKCPYMLNRFLKTNPSSNYLTPTANAQSVERLPSVEDYNLPSGGVWNSGDWTDMYWMEWYTPTSHRGCFIKFSTEEMGFERALGYYNPGSPSTFRYFTDKYIIPTDETSSEIMGFSISRICPYEYTATFQNVGGYGYDVIITVDGASMEEQTGSSGYFYDCSKLTLKDPNTYTIHLSDMEMACGDVAILDYAGNAVGSIPTWLADANNDLVITEQTYSDLTQIYTRFKCGDYYFDIPHANMPYVSDVYHDYMAMHRDTDRLEYNNRIERVQNNLMNSKYELRQQYNLDMAANSGLAEIAGAITAFNITNLGIGSVSSALQSEITKQQLSRQYRLDSSMLALKAQEEMRQTQMDMELSKRQALAEPTQNYNSGWGYKYLYESSQNDMKICTRLPGGLTASEFNDYISWNGYNVEGMATIQAKAGYYRGVIPNIMSLNLTGRYFDELNKNFNNGFRFVRVV